MDKLVYMDYIKNNFGASDVKSIVLTLVGGEKVNISSANSINFINDTLILEYVDTILCIDFNYVLNMDVIPQNYDDVSMLLNDEFFIIDSNNLNSVNSKLYGYSILDNHLIFNENVEKYKLDGNGAYINILKSNNNICISQDFIGAYGLYIYRYGDYFAISNSFLKLVEYLKNESLTLNKDYANAFLFADLCSFAYGETLVNEINVLPRNYIINININNKSLRFDEIDYEEHTIELDSVEGLNLLDTWFNKWIDIIRLINFNTSNLSFDLSGGFDSRIIATLFLSSGIDLNKVRVLSYKSDYLSEDYKIASEIADFYNFNLNNSHFSSRYDNFVNISDPINLLFYVKLGFHKEMAWRTYYNTDSIFWFSGYGGESIRKYYDKSSKEFINYISDKVSKYSYLLSDSSKRISRDSLNDLRIKYDVSDSNSYDLPEMLYKEVRCRNHFGKSSITAYLTNVINMTPLLDPIIHKLNLTTSNCDDKYLLMALIFVRYCPKLLDFDFDGGRQIDSNTIEIAKKINEISEFKGIKNFSNDFFADKKMSLDCKGLKTYTFKDLNDIFIKFVCSQKFKDKFNNIFPANLYNEIIKGLDSNNYLSLSNIYSAIAIVYVLDLINYKNYMNFWDWFIKCSDNL